MNEPRRLRFAVLILPLAALLLAAGCASDGGLAEGPQLAVTRLDALPAPSRVDLTSNERPYLIGPFDKLSVTVFGVEELSVKEIQADAGGRLSLPLIGEISAAGQTPAELGHTIEAALGRRYVRDPRVSVNLVEAVSQVVTVDGAVREPGLYPVVGRMTLMRAVATAKGTTEFAATDKVVVFRTVDRTNYAALYSLADIRQGRYLDPEIFAKDVVVVGDSPARRLFRDLVQVLPTVAVVASTTLR